MPDLKTRTYAISINGIQESIDAVASLNKQLDALSERIESLSKKATINIRTGGGTSTSTVEKEDAQDALEVNKVLEEQKQIRKQLANEAKDLLAADRLNAGQYSDTMAGLKQELSDIKRVMQHTELGSETFAQMSQRAGELTQKLKDIEAAYGTFSRNVGNYQSAFDGLNGITVVVGGVERQFNSVRDASRQLNEELKAMVINGQDDTEEYEELADAVGDFNKKVQQAESAVNDLKSSSQGMDEILDMFESFASMASIEKGVSAFFGFDDKEIQRSIQQLVGLQNALQGLEKIRKQMNTGEGIGRVFNLGSKAADQMTVKVLGSTAAMKGLTAAEIQATTAGKVLSVTLKALGIGLVIAAVAGLVEGVTYLVDKLKDWYQGNSKLYDSNKQLQSSVQAVNDELERQRTLLSDEYAKGNITYEEYQKKLAEEELEARQKLVNGIRDQIAASDDLSDKTKENLQMGALYAKNSQQMVAALDEEVAKLQETRDLTKEQKEQMIALQQQAVGTFYNMAESGKHTTAELAKMLESSRSLKAALANIDEVFPDEALRTKIQGLIDMLNKAKTATVSAFQIEQWEIDAMQDGLDKIKAQHEKNLREIDTLYANDEKARTAARAAEDKKYLDNVKSYNKQQQQEAKKQSETMKKAEESLQKLRIDAMKQGFQKELAEIAYERQRRLDEAKKTYTDLSKYTEAASLINTIYDKKVEDAEKKYYDERVKAAKEFASRMRQLDRQIQESRKASLEADISVDDLKERLEKAIQETVDKLEKESVNIAKAYNQAHQANDAEFGKIIKRRKEILEQELDAERKLLNWAYDERFKKLKDEKNAELNALEAALTNEEVDVREYNKRLNDIGEKYAELRGYLTEQQSAEYLRLKRQYQEKEQAEYKEHFETEIALLRTYYASVQKLASEQPTMKNGIFGDTINIRKSANNYKKVLEDVAQIRESILGKDGKEKWAKKALEDGLISQEQYNEIHKDLKELENEITETEKDVSKKLKKITSDAIGSYMQLISQYTSLLGNALQDILSSVWDYQDALFDKRMEDLDKQLDIIQKFYDKQEEITQQHADAINSIEDELATARGDRREQLIDNLSAQIQAQRASLAAEKKLEKDKEMLEAQKEKEEKEQAKKEKQRALAQAIISGGLAIVNALATNPFIPMGIAAGALATTTTAVQIAMIRKQQILADGGLIQGPSHKNGGVKVGNSGVEVEGGEFVTNRRTTDKNLPLLEFINASHRRLTLNDFDDYFNGKVKKNFSRIGSKFANGGKLPQLSSNDRLLRSLIAYSERPTVVQVVDIINETENLNKVKVLAGLN